MHLHMEIEPAHGHPASFVKSAETGPRQLKCWRFNRHQRIGRKRSGIKQSHWNVSVFG